MPTIATRSRIPLLAICDLLSLRRGGDGLSRSSCGRRRRSSRRRKVISTRSPILTDGRVHVGELAGEAAAALEVEHAHHHRRRERVGEPVHGVGRDGRGHVGHALGRHLVHRVALEADARGRQVPRAAGLAAAAGEAELPRLGPARGRRGRRHRIGPARRLALEEAAPGEEGRCRRRARRPRPARPPASRWRRLASAAVARHSVTSQPSASVTTAMRSIGLGAVERVREEERGVRGAGVAHRAGEIVGEGAPSSRPCPPPRACWRGHAGPPRPRARAPAR